MATTRNLNRIVHSTSHPEPETGDSTTGTHDRPHGVHAMPLSILFGVFAALVFLTVVTVAVRYVDLGPANIWIALGVAAVKALLVAAYFMHLRWDSPFNTICLVSAMLFVVIFIGALLADTKEVQPNQTPPQGAKIQQAL